MDALGYFLMVALTIVWLFPGTVGRWWADFKIAYGSRMNE